MTIENKLNEALDNILYQIKRGVSIDEIKKGIFWIEL